MLYLNLQDILEFIEDSPHGVIFFTFGSVVSITSLPENIQKAFKEAFAQVPQKVLWKYEGEMKDKPKNVITRKWFPQRDILRKYVCKTRLTSSITCRNDICVKRIEQCYYIFITFPFLSISFFLLLHGLKQKGIELKNVKYITKTTALTLPPN